MPAACRNCEAPLPQPAPRFCPACGQETLLRPPTLGEFAQQFGGAYLSTEGALFRTLRLLLLRPGELTRQYLGGRRKHYVLPLRLYLTISLLVLLAMRLTATVGINFDDVKTADRRPQNMVVEFGVARAGLREGVFFCERFPQWVCTRLQRRIDVDARQLQREFVGIAERVLANMGAAMFVLLPGFALWLKLVYWNRRLHYTEHLVFALHVHAFWFLMLALTFADLQLLSFLSMLAVPVYTWFALRRVYGGRWWPRLLRAGLVSGLYLVMLALSLAGVGLWALLF